MYTYSYMNTYIYIYIHIYIYMYTFRLFMQTKLSNPHYPPDVQAECTAINNPHSNKS